MKERAEEERQEKRNRMKQRKEDYRKLMEEANLHGKYVIFLLLHIFDNFINCVMLYLLSLLSILNEISL